MHLSAPVTVLIREIDAAEAPVAYRVTTDDEYSRFEDRTLTRRYSSTIRAKDIVRRLEALGCTAPAQEDDDALAALG